MVQRVVWCWEEPQYICPSSGDSYMLTQAIADFYRNLDRKWEYRNGGRGQDSDGNGLYETDCWYLVDSTLRKMGYEGLGLLGARSTNDMSIANNPEKFCRVDCENAQPGDIIVWEGLDNENPYTPWPGHIAFVLTPTKLVDGECTGSLFEATTLGEGPPGVKLGRKWRLYERVPAKWDSAPNGPREGRLQFYGIYRPKKKIYVTKCVGFPEPPLVRPVAHRMDPLVLDLDGNGIKTLGISAGIHFDHDCNGFKELTGWVGQGDGMLVLDKNGDDRLDDGSELFGDFTILPDGTRAASGFQALAYYDSNSDLKIDAHDPIWSQLRVWQHYTYIFPAGEG